MHIVGEAARVQDAVPTKVSLQNSKEASASNASC